MKTVSNPSEWDEGKLEEEEYAKNVTTHRASPVKLEKLAFPRWKRHSLGKRLSAAKD